MAATVRATSTKGPKSDESAPKKLCWPEYSAPPLPPLPFPDSCGLKYCSNEEFDRANPKSAKFRFDDLASEEDDDEVFAAEEEEELAGGADARLLGRPDMKLPLLQLEFEMFAVSPFSMLISSCRPDMIYGRKKEGKCVLVSTSQVDKEGKAYSPAPSQQASSSS